MFSSLWLRHTSNKWDGIPNKTSRILWVVPLSDPKGDYHLMAKGRLSIGQLSWQYLRWSSVSLSQWSSGSVCSAILSLRFDYDNRRLFVLQWDSEGESKRTQFVQQHVSRLQEGSYVNSVYDASVLTTTCILSSCDEKRVEVAWKSCFLENLQCISAWKSQNHFSIVALVFLYPSCYPWRNCYFGRKWCAVEIWFRVDWQSVNDAIIFSLAA